MAKNSSIFNFEPLSKALRLPFRTHLWHGVVLAGFVLLLWFAASAMPSALQPVKEKDSDGLAEAEILVLGNSQLMAIREDRLPFPMKNYALGGTGYRTHEAFLRHLAPKMPKLRVLILGFDNIPLRNPDIEQRGGDFRHLVAYGLPWRDIPATLQQRIEFAAGSWGPFAVFTQRKKFDAGEWLKRYLTPPVDAAIDDGTSAAHNSIYRPQGAYSFSVTDGGRKMRMYDLTMRNDDALAASRKAFFDIFRYCSKHDIQVVLLRTPTTPAFWGTRTRNWNAELLTLLDEARDRVPETRAVVWDAEQGAVDTHLEDYFDPNHLRPHGAVKLEAFLFSRLRSPDFPDDTDELFTRPEDNLLATPDFREGPWTGLRNKPAAIEILEDAVEIDGTIVPAFRIRLGPGESLLQAAKHEVAPSETYIGRAWIWSESTVKSPSLLLSVTRHGTTAFNGTGIEIKELAPDPQLFEVRHTLGSEDNAVRLHLKNNAGTPIEFLISHPQLQQIGRAMPAGVAALRKDIDGVELCRNASFEQWAGSAPLEWYVIEGTIAPDNNATDGMMAVRFEPAADNKGATRIQQMLRAPSIVPGAAIEIAVDTYAADRGLFGIGVYAKVGDTQEVISRDIDGTSGWVNHPGGSQWRTLRAVAEIPEGADIDSVRLVIMLRAGAENAALADRVSVKIADSDE